MEWDVSSQRGVKGCFPVMEVNKLIVGKITRISSIWVNWGVLTANQLLEIKLILAALGYPSPVSNIRDLHRGIRYSGGRYLAILIQISIFSGAKFNQVHDCLYSPSMCVAPKTVT